MTRKQHEQKQPQQNGGAAANGRKRGKNDEDDVLLGQAVQAAQATAAPAAGTTGKNKAKLQQQQLQRAQRQQQHESAEQQEEAALAAEQAAGSSASAEEWRQYLEMEARQRRAHHEAMSYTNAWVGIENADWFSAGPNKWVRLEQFTDSERIESLVALFTEHLSEPYSVFTYRHFVFEFPDLTILMFGVESPTKPAATDKTGALVGCIVSKVSKKMPTYHLRGYIAMLAVQPSFRGQNLGKRLVTETVALMRRKGCAEVLLETPTTNQRALKLYTDLGFAKQKFLTKYYLEGQDAVRLKLWLSDPGAIPDSEPPAEATGPAEESAAVPAS